MHNLWLKIKWLSKNMRPIILPFLFSLFINIICSLNGIFLALLTKHLIDSAAMGKLNIITQYLFLIIFLIVVDVGARAAISIITTSNSVKISTRLQERLFTHLSKVEWLQISKYHSGDLLTRITADVDAVTNLLNTTLPQIISLSTTLIGAIAFLIAYEPLLVFPALIIGPFTIIISRFFNHRMKPLYMKIQQTESQCRSFIHESLQNIAIIKAFCVEEQNTEQIKKLNYKKLYLTCQRSRVGAASNSALLLGSWLGYLLVFGWGAIALSKGISTFGTFTALLQLVGYLQGPFAGLSQILPRIISSLTSAERLIELQNLATDSQDTSIHGVSFTKLQAGLKLEHVSFWYEIGKEILEDASVNICPGDIVAITGSSGEGKTTFVRILLSFIHPQKGHAYITIGQHNYEISATTRHFISYVPQVNTLFSGTIAENLRYGCPDATDMQLEEAARSACAWEFIKYLKDGLYTIIGEHGFGLSEGQAQRLSIARAILHKSPIILMDEATSALDINTELRVLQAIRYLRPKRTCLLITHRLAALEICNKVFKLENSCLSEVTVNSIEASTTGVI